MKPSEKMGKPPEQSGEELVEVGERKITTPEIVKEMTRQRRKEYGLGESSELTLKEIKEIDTVIRKLLERLDGYDYDGLSPEVQDEWYWVEQEADVGKDRELVKAVLEEFLKRLENTLKGKVE